MSRDRKLRLVRILAVLAVFAALLVLRHAGALDRIGRPAEFLLYFIPYLVIGYDVIRKAFRNIVRGNVFDENFLMTLATFAAFGLGLTGAGEYPEALAVMLFYQTGELFQDLAVDRSRRSIAEMMSIAPEYANVLRDGRLEKADPEDVGVGDTIMVLPGEKIPLDGVVLEGESYLDTAALTGESVPRRAAPGDEVISGCVNGSGTLTVRTTKEYEDSTVARILDLVENAGSRKAKLENFITRFARYYTPVVTAGAVLLALILPLVLRTGWADGIRRACNFLIVSCPCALVISVPLGFFGGIGAASRIGVLAKGSNCLEILDRVDTLVMDKTGTLTHGRFRVTKAVPAPGSRLDGQGLIDLAAHAEALSSHPAARSVCEACGRPPDLGEVSAMEEEAGRGIRVLYRGRELLAGNAALLESRGIRADAPQESGSVVHVAYDGRYEGCIVIADTVREEAARALREMKEAGIRSVVMLTGDRRETAEEIAGQLGISRFFAELLPADKVAGMEMLMEAAEKNGDRGCIGFVGDGINDAPVLMRADVGIAMGGLGSDAAIEAADIVIMDDDLRRIPAAKRIARRTMTIVRTNIVFAIAVKVLILALSALGLASMWMAVFGDVGVAVLCVLNSMRALNAQTQ